MYCYKSYIMLINMPNLGVKMENCLILMKAQSMVLEIATILAKCSTVYMIH